MFSLAAQEILTCSVAKGDLLWAYISHSSELGGALLGGAAPAPGALRKMKADHSPFPSCSKVIIEGSVQFSSVTQLCLTLFDPMDCSTPGLPVHHHLLDLAQTHGHRAGDATKPSHPLSSPSPLPSIFPRISMFSNVSVLPIKWPKYWTFSFSIISSNKYSGLIFFNKKRSLCSPRDSRVFFNTTAEKHQLFSVPLTLWSNSQHPHMTTGKTIALTTQTFVGN